MVRVQYDTTLNGLIITEFSCQSRCILLNNGYALVNQIPPPGQMRGFDKGIDEKHLPLGRAFDMTP